MDLEEKIGYFFLVAFILLAVVSISIVVFAGLKQSALAEIPTPPQVIGAWADGDTATIAYLYENNVTLMQYRRGVPEFTDSHTLQCAAQSIAVTIASDAATVFIACKDGWLDTRFSQLYYVMAAGVEYRTFMPLVIR